MEQRGAGDWIAGRARPGHAGARADTGRTVHVERGTIGWNGRCNCCGAADQVRGTPDTGGLDSPEGST